ncbi:MAG TPA: MarR family transcriptional regulator [Mycobacteriales bacterium]|nr:MarR family transcriptional regulator [Mycobacteriales bacterium]
MLDDDLGWSLGVVFRTYVRTAEALVSELPGGPRGFQVLAAAAQELPVAQGVLAQRLGIDRTVMTYLVDDLEAAGLVARRPVPDDRRNKQIVATEAGRARWEQLRTRLARAEDHVLAPLTGQDRDRFRTLLRTLALRAQELDPVTDACAMVEDLDGARPRHSARH